MIVPRNIEMKVIGNVSVDYRNPVYQLHILQFRPFSQYRQFYQERDIFPKVFEVIDYFER